MGSVITLVPNSKGMSITKPKMIGPIFLAIKKRAA
jgi:hypothetical protein